MPYIVIIKPDPSARNLGVILDSTLSMSSVNKYRANETLAGLHATTNWMILFGCRDIPRSKNPQAFADLTANARMVWRKSRGNLGNA